MPHRRWWTVDCGRLETYLADDGLLFDEDMPGFDAEFDMYPRATAKFKPRSGNLCHLYIGITRTDVGAKSARSLTSNFHLNRCEPRAGRCITEIANPLDPLLDVDSARATAIRE